MNCYIFAKESHDPSISDVRKQFHCYICQEILDHSDVEVVDCIPNNPQDNDEDEFTDDDDQEKLSNSGDFQQDSDKVVDHDNDSVGSEDQDE